MAAKSKYIKIPVDIDINIEREELVEYAEDVVKDSPCLWDALAERVEDIAAKHIDSLTDADIEKIIDVKSIVKDEIRARYR